MNNFDFRSQICTTQEQSARLLNLGIKKETADMIYAEVRCTDGSIEWSASPIMEGLTALDYEDNWPPAWSLGRLIEMMPEEMYGGLLCIFKDSIRYEEVIMDRLEAHFEAVGDNMYENAISCIEWLIKEGCFNIKYLV